MIRDDSRLFKIIQDDLKRFEDYWRWFKMIRRLFEDDSIWFEDDSRWFEMIRDDSKMIEDD